MTDLRSQLLLSLDRDLELAPTPPLWFCNKCGYFGKEGPLHKGPVLGHSCSYHAGAVPFDPWTARFRTLGPLALKAIREQVLDNHIPELGYCDTCQVVTPDRACPFLRSIASALYPELLKENS